MSIQEQVDARKNPIARDEALKIARTAGRIWAAKGKKVVAFDLKKDEPTDDELAKAILGPTGNLRAPAIRRGKKMFVGFHAEELAAQML